MHVLKGHNSTDFFRINVGFSQQRGVILVVAMVMLLAMTLIGITVMSSATLQERMAGNNRQLSLARLYAESALRQAEQDLENLTIKSREDIPGQFQGKTGFYYPSIDHQVENVLDVDLTDPQNWTLSNSFEAASVVGSGTSVKSPRYVIEHIGFLAPLEIQFTTGPSINDTDRFDMLNLSLAFRITAIGYGKDDNITAILESVYSTGQGSAAE